MLSKQRALENIGCTIGYISVRPYRSGPPDPSTLMHLRVHEWLMSASCYDRLTRACKAWNPDILVVSGVWVSLGWKRLRRLRRELGIPVSFEIQGALEEFIEYNIVAGSRLASRLLFHAARSAEAAALQHVADHVEVVSDNMVSYVRQAYPRYSGPMTVVPCGIDTAFDDATYARNRSRWRRRLALDPAGPAAVYSGSMSKWQRVAEIIDIARATPRLQTYLFLVGDASALPADLPSNVRIASLSHEDLVEALCAFDFGFLLRRSDWTNLVAFPNKASEYLNARLRIIVDTTDLGCMRPEFAPAFARLADTDLSTAPPLRPALDLRDILWPNSATRLLKEYLALAASPLPSQSEEKSAPPENVALRCVQTGPPIRHSVSR
jgi:glycosyltransferase involved in cell wall biosynthesis